MKTIPLTILLHEGPIASAYLAVLQARNLKPVKIIKLIYKNHHTTGKPLLRWLPGPLRIGAAERMQRAAFNFWPTELSSTYGSVKDHIGWYLESEGLPCAVFSDSARVAASDLYASVTKTLFVDGFSDPSLEAAVVEAETANILFTGGGLMPASLLDIPGVRFLHIHPGYLPMVRGADGILWSQLIRGVPGATCFEMAKGIDLGDVVAKREFGTFKVPIDPGQRPVPETLYRIIFSFLDPWIRALLLDDVIADNPGLDFEAVPQEKRAGVTQHFMHPELRQIAFSSMFPDKSRMS
jgi:hypothetical protein